MQEIQTQVLAVSAFTTSKQRSDTSQTVDVQKPMEVKSTVAEKVTVDAFTIEEPQRHAVSESIQLELRPKQIQERQQAVLTKLPDIVEKLGDDSDQAFTTQYETKVCKHFVFLYISLNFDRDMYSRHVGNSFSVCIELQVLCLSYNSQ